MLAARLRRQGVAAERVGLDVPLPNRPETPAWGRRGKARMAVSIDSHRGWEFDLTERPSPFVTVVAPFDAAGVEAVATLAINVTANKLGNPFVI